MDGVPLHPALTHVPLGLAVVLPIVTAAVLFAVWSGKLGRRPILLVVVLQATVVASGWSPWRPVSTRPSASPPFVPEAALSSHAEWGERFVIASAVTLALSLAALFVPWRGTSRGALAATVVTGALAAGSVSTRATTRRRARLLPPSGARLGAPRPRARRASLGQHRRSRSSPP
ncbi:MAG: hypothetical protein M5U28_49370 [Sandaracinaceae bacterium]|nr:hypothetical protein [Sandaracinaceae bacterium]